MFNPLKNMLIVDAGITTERLTKSRNKHEFMEYAIKEGSLLFLLYVAGKWLKTGLEGISSKLLKTPIDLDLRFLNSDILKDQLGTQKLTNELKSFREIRKPKEVLDYIFKKRNSESAIVEGAKLSGIISKFDSTDNIDPTKYIDTKEVIEFVENLEKFAIASKNADSPLDFIKKVSIFANLGICCATLGYIVPKAMFAYRKQNSGSKEFHVEKEIRKKLEQSFSSNTI